jgi:hypothetical protein
VTAPAIPGLAKTIFGIGGDYVRIGDLIDEPGDLLEQIASEATVVEVDEDNDEEEDGDESS